MTLTLSTKALVIAVAWGIIAAMLAMYGIANTIAKAVEEDDASAGCSFLFLSLIALTVTACAVFMM